MSDAIDGYRDLQECRQQERAEKRVQETAKILELRGLGYEVRQITEYHFRVDGKLDLYPTRGRWHNMRAGKRGFYRDAAAIAVAQLGGPLRSVEGT